VDSVSVGPARTSDDGIRLVVTGRRELADEVVELALRRPDGTAVPAWQPGAHIELVLDNDLVRQYSLLGSPSDRTEWRIGVLREPQGRGGSEFIHAEVSPGHEIVTRGPRNNFPFVPSKHYIFIAGGIGITPLVSMIEWAEASDSTWQLFYGGRTRSTMALRDELAAFGSRVSVIPEDEHGLLDLEAILAKPRGHTAIYCCGPEPLISAVELQAERWPTGSLHVERFKPRDVGDESSNSAAFHVDLLRSGVSLEVPTGRSVLEVIDEAGIDILSSCEDGICGTCQVTVLSGIPEHRDSVLSAEERRSNTTMMPCVSRARTPRLALDL
jgi:ferredoxin-NADP reductase